MLVSTIAHSTGNMTVNGLCFHSKIHYQLSSGDLVQDTLRRKEGALNDTGALVIQTGRFTGRSPKDKFIVKDDSIAASVHWNDFNIPIEEKYFDIVLKKVYNYLNDKDELWVRDCYACADERFRMNIRAINETPSGNLFVYNMFLRPDDDELSELNPEWTILSAPGLQLDPAECGTRQSNATLISLKHKTIIVAGSGYTGEMKKGIFTVLNYLLPMQHKVLSMHCSANMGAEGDSALFFGLSGTGKTTLSTDPERMLIGDDEHGWSNNNIFNFEGGCYAKTIDLTPEKEPEIFSAIRPGALVENTGFIEGTNTIDFTDRSVTENTRVSYPIHFIEHARQPSVGSIPANIFFLTCDAYGVLPPISKLTPDQAMYQFISGYTAKVAGTETGITEPTVTFSACFGAPFLPLHPGKYASMLGEKIRRHQVKVWLINTGWTGGPYGAGSRIKLAFTRAMIKAALSGALSQVAYEPHPVFGMDIPMGCPGVPAKILYPRDTWSDKDNYDIKARALAQSFIYNFEKYASGVDKEILAAAPRIPDC